MQQHNESKNKVSVKAFNMELQLCLWRFSVERCRIKTPSPPPAPPPTLSAGRHLNIILTVCRVAARNRANIAKQPPAQLEKADGRISSGSIHLFILFFFYLCQWTDWTISIKLYQMSPWMYRVRHHPEPNIIFLMNVWYCTGFKMLKPDDSGYTKLNLSQVQQSCRW